MEGWSLSFVNAVLMSVLGFKAVGFPSEQNSARRFLTSDRYILPRIYKLYYPNDTQDSISIALLASYLLADLPILIPYYKARFLDIAHHFATLGLCYEILYRSVLPSHKAFIMLTELSTVFLDLARILPVVGLGKSPAFLASGVAFAVSFIGVRVVWYGIRLVRADYLGVDPDWKALGRLGKWIARGLFGLQVWWVGEIAEKAIEIFGKKK